MSSVAGDRAEHDAGLLQEDTVRRFLSGAAQTAWQTVYLSADGDAQRLTVWCAFVPPDAASRALADESWDLQIGHGAPGFSQSWPDGENVDTTYHRFGSSDGIRPLLLYRDFHSAFPSYIEVDEEFRLYHNLAEDKQRGMLLDFDPSGREIEVVRIHPDSVEAKLRYLRQFQAATGLYLAIYVDSVRYSTTAVAELPHELLDQLVQTKYSRWRRSIRSASFKPGFKTLSRLLGKPLLAPPDRSRAGKWPYQDEPVPAKVSFIIGVDKDGEPVEHDSNPDLLSDYFGNNRGAAHYLTPVHFRREVLAKYYAEPDRYKVSDGRLTCLGLWSCQIDNDLPSSVVVFLGDLGRDLPYEERLHWRQFNVAPNGPISRTNFRRSFLAEFSDPTQPDLQFRAAYRVLNENWTDVNGWPLFLPLSAGDAHLLDTIRVPATNSQPEFDEQVGYLTKLLVDSLNERELASRIHVEEGGAKGITKLDKFLETTGFPGRTVFIQLFRDIQTLRSTGSAHRKGAQYEKIATKLGLTSNSRREVMRGLLSQASTQLLYLNEFTSAGLRPVAPAPIHGTQQLS